MSTAGFRFANVAGRGALVDGAGGWHDVERLSEGRVSADPMAGVDDRDTLRRLAGSLDADRADGQLVTATLGPPVPAPRQVFGVGLNYRDHAAETGADIPDVPLVFTKFAGCLAGPHDDVRLAVDTADHEVELVVVIGRGGRNIPASAAWESVLGLTVGQDISDRALQRASRPPQFSLGKSRDTYGPIGPVLVAPELFDDPDDLHLTCSVNGEMRQDGRTSDLIFGVPALIEYLSAVLTLHPGDLVFTGTPAGVGVARGEFLTPGDEITSTIDGIGTMVNRCVA